jgi:hypothetical protein
MEAFTMLPVKTALVVLITASLTAAAAAQDADPIGPLTRVSVFDPAQKINVGKTASGQPVCYFREEGSSHTLGIGVAADGAFLRLETFDSRETTPKSPLRPFAGKQGERGGYVTNELTVLQPYKGRIEFYTTKPDQGDFTVIAKADPQALFEMVARARNEFVVVQSVTDPKTVDIVAIYHFTAANISALLACAKARIQ